MNPHPRYEIIEVVRSQSTADYDAICALRYSVYVQEMGRSQDHADHERMRVTEPEDAGAHLLLARTQGGEVVGTARVHLGESVPRSLEEMYLMRRFGPYFPHQTSATTRLMVDRRYRRSPVALHLAQACYAIGMTAGMRFNFIDCNAHLRSFFTRLGFRQVFPAFVHPDYGEVTPLVLALRDFDHLRGIGSPLAYPTNERIDLESVAFFTSLLQHSPPSLSNA